MSRNPSAVTNLANRLAISDSQALGLLTRAKAAGRALAMEHEFKEIVSLADYGTIQKSE
jgi:hypothetical protein